MIRDSLNPTSSRASWRISRLPHVAMKWQPYLRGGSTLMILGRRAGARGELPNTAKRRQRTTRPQALVSRSKLRRHWSSLGHLGARVIMGERTRTEASVKPINRLRASAYLVNFPVLKSFSFNSLVQAPSLATT